MTAEATITINGHLLTEAQAMTIRVALESFAHELVLGGLDYDRHGSRMADAYQARIDEIRALSDPGRHSHEQGTR